MGAPENYQSNDFQVSSQQETHSSKSNSSNIVGEVQIKGNTKVGISKLSSTDKSTSAASSVTSTPPLIAVRAPNEKLEDKLSLNNK